jgi:acetyltransferase-like isoleucine patch superfamily enzyme
VNQDKPWNTESEETIIGNDVWIGANSTVLAGVKIGDGAIIGAHSLVNKDVAPYSIVVGVPAKHLRFRHSEAVIKQLLKTEWWNMSKEQLTKHIDAAANAESFLDSI